MIKRLKRVLIGVAGGMAVPVVRGLVLIHTLGDRDRLYQGKPIEFWANQINSPEVVASNQARVVIQTAIIPVLTETMFRDTGDSRLRSLLIDELDTLPGVNIYFIPAAGRRAGAAASLGGLGPQAQSSIPDLIKALKGTDSAVRGAAAKA